MRHTLLLIYAFLAVAFILKGQDTEQEFNEFMNTIHGDFDTSLTRNSAEVNLFTDSLNADYMQFLQDAEKVFISLLKKSFSEHLVTAPDSIAEELKPTKVTATKSPVGGLSEIRIREAFIPGPSLPEALIVMPSGMKRREPPKGNVHLGFLGHTLVFLIDSGIINFQSPDEITPLGIADSYAILNTTPCYPLIQQCLMHKTRLNLNDWGYFLLVDRLTKSLFRDVNTQRLVAWYILLKTGYKVKSGMAENTVFILFAPRQNIYGMPYLNMNDDRYYLWEYDGNGEGITTYDCEYIHARKYFNLIQDLPILPVEERTERPVSFSYKEKLYRFSLYYDKQYVEYLSRCPETDLHYYFSIPVSSVFKESVNTNLRSFITNKSQTEALDFLLAMVQYSFSYKTDQEQFGHEKYMLPEEVLFYPHSDCEDRTAFFIYLVNELLNLNIIALDFEGHVCAAVEITDGSASGSVLYNNRNYLACDPTYTGAPAGIVMPSFREKKARIIDFNAYQNAYKFSRLIWSVLNRGGGYEAGSGNTVICDSTRSGYATGIYQGLLTLGELHSESTDSSIHAFLVKMDSRNEPEWIRTFDGPGNIYTYCLAHSLKNNLFLMGYFEKGLATEGRQLESDESGNFFVAKYTDKGDLVWLKKIPHSLISGKSAGFSAIIDSAGNLVFVKAMDHDYFPDHQIAVDADENCYLTGITPLIRYATDSNKYYSDGGDFDLISYLVSENERLMDQHYPETMSLFYSLIHFITNTNTARLSGTILQRTLRSVNDEIEHESPQVYSNVGKINSIDQMNGLLHLRTIDMQPVFLAPLKAENNAMVKLGYQFDNARLDVLDGVAIGNTGHWFDLNYIVFDKTSGEIIYNYDNHYQKRMPVHSELIR